MSGWIAAAGLAMQMYGMYQQHQAYQIDREMSRDETKLRIEQAQARMERQARIIREQTDLQYEFALETTEWNERTKAAQTYSQIDRMAREDEKLGSKQQAQYSGMGIGGASSEVVMRTAKQEGARDRSEVWAGYETSREQGRLQLEQSRIAGERTHDWYIQELEQETGFEIAALNAYLDSLDGGGGVVEDLGDAWEGMTDLSTEDFADTPFSWMDAGESALGAPTEPFSSIHEWAGGLF